MRLHWCNFNAAAGRKYGVKHRCKKRILRVLFSPYFLRFLTFFIFAEVFIIKNVGKIKTLILGNQHSKIYIMQY
jgi:hypothetical protein